MGIDRIYLNIIKTIYEKSTANNILLVKSCREGNGNPLQYSCLENPMDRGTWQVTAHGVTRVGHNLAIIVLLLAHFQLFATP